MTSECLIVKQHRRARDMDNIYVNQRPGDTGLVGNNNHSHQEAYRKQYEKNEQNSSQAKVMGNQTNKFETVRKQPIPEPRLQTIAAKIPLTGLKFNKQIGIDFFGFLESVSDLFITQKVDFIEAVTAISGENKFAILDSEGQCRLVASEKSGFCDRLLCGLNRSFRLQIRDTSGNLCLELERSIDCNICCGLLFPDKLNVYLANEIPIGTICQRKHLKPSYSIKNAIGETKLILEGGWCPIHCPGSDTHFELLEYQFVTKNGESKQKRVKRPNGSLVKKWVGCGKEFCTEADDFVLQFPTNTTPTTKALCLAAVFMIVSLYLLIIDIYIYFHIA